MQIDKNMAQAPFGIYIHWPFCQKKCPYCDFNSHTQKNINQSAFTDALITELNYMVQNFGFEKRPLDSIFFGGGTPSLMDPAMVERILTAIETACKLDATCEITLEANPTTLEATKLAGFRSAGINRLSMGIQSLNDRNLAFLGRQHSAEEAQNALKTAQNIFARISADFIYALPNQTLKAWQEELKQILDLGCTHLSLYQLTLEQGTAFYSLEARGKLTMLDDAEAVEQFLYTQELCTHHALPAYEVSNHAQADAQCRHNLIYWQGGDWLGIGPGAVGRFCHQKKRIETRTRKSPETWRQTVSNLGHGITSTHSEVAADYASEMLMMGLRLTQGIALNQIAARTDCRENWLNKDALNRLTAEGLLIQTSDILRIAPKGWHLMNSIIEQLLK